MDIYRVIRESKEGKLFDVDELNKLYSFANDQILLKIVARNDQEKEDDKEELADMAEIVLKNRDNFWTAKHEDELEDFSKELESEIKSKIKKGRMDIKKDLFNRIDEIAQSNSQKIDTGDSTPNSIFFKLFLSEYNTKHAFTWKAFKDTKKRFEKTHPVDGEDIYILKSVLEKEPRIDKVVDSTVFCKASKTLSDDVIEKLKEKAGE